MLKEEVRKMIREEVEKYVSEFLEILNKFLQPIEEEGKKYDV